MFLRLWVSILSVWWKYYIKICLGASLSKCTFSDNVLVA